MAPNVKKPTEVSISEALAKMDPSGLAAFMANPPDTYPDVPKYRLMRFLNYYGFVFSDVSCPWHVMFNKSNLSKLLDNIDVRFSNQKKSLMIPYLFMFFYVISKQVPFSSIPESV